VLPRPRAYRGATQPVLGEGAKDAEVMMVGEQPGDREDIEGHPFVGPAGRILDQGLEQAGIPREDVYSSNVVKHFRYKLRGKRRIHQKPDRWHVSACLPWLDAELQVVKPERLGPIDIWVNNAMTSVFDFFEDSSAAEYERATRVTYLGAIWGTKAALARMIPRDHGTVVQIGSALAYRGIPLQSPYCGAKHAIKGSFASLRCELRRRGSGVHLTMVQLPGLNTPQFDHCLSRMPRHPMPVPPIFQPEVAARAVYSAPITAGARSTSGTPTSANRTR
jgi:uracil-DNA glycosylase family 4